MNVTSTHRESCSGRVSRAPRDVHRPGSDGDSIVWRTWSHGRTLRRARRSAGATMVSSPPRWVGSAVLSRAARHWPLASHATPVNIPVLMAGSLASALPAIIVYLIFQRHLVRGLTMGIGK